MLGEWYLPPGKCQAISTITEGIISISHPAPLSSQTRIPQTSSPLVDKSQATQAALLQIRRSEAGLVTPCCLSLARGLPGQHAHPLDHRTWKDVQAPGNDGRGRARRRRDIEPFVSKAGLSVDSLAAYGQSASGVIKQGLSRAWGQTEFQVNLKLGLTPSAGDPKRRTCRSQPLRPVEVYLNRRRQGSQQNCFTVRPAVVSVRATLNRPPSEESRLPEPAPGETVSRGNAAASESLRQLLRVHLEQLPSGVTRQAQPRMPIGRLLPPVVRPARPLAAPAPASTRKRLIALQITTTSMPSRSGAAWNGFSWRVGHIDRSRLSSAL